MKPRPELWSELVSRGGARLATGGFVLSSAHTTTRSLFNAESTSISMPRTAEAAGIVREGHVVRTWKSDSDYSEWYVGPITMTHGVGAMVDIVARSPLYKLGECGLVTEPGIVPQDGLPVVDFTVTATPSALIDAYLVDRDPVDALATELSWVSRGTVDPTVEVTLNVSWWSPLQFLTALIDALLDKGEICELWFLRNGTTDYTINITREPAT